LKQIEPSTGSGATVADANIVQEDRLALSNARGMYAEYEMGDVSVMPETFVPHAVIGNDDRRAVLDTRDYPARAVVQILFETRTGSPHLCSGALPPQRYERRPTLPQFPGDTRQERRSCPLRAMPWTRSLLAERLDHFSHAG
jgi:hypothetical protein